MKTPLTARIAAVFYALWGLVHVAGASVQLLTLRRDGAGALTALVGSGAAVDPDVAIPGAAAAFMGMGAANIGLIGLLVTAVAVLNWRNSRLGYWLNLLVVGGTDLGLVVFLLLPGIMAWGDGLVGLALFGPAAVFSTIARAGAARSLASAPALQGSAA